mmetsp:Transcript_14969/g.20920  ORF Transcript_14969/g.20920 Transcript_14969/m.20920 type:complete len:1071 (+) Transcript_14969:86-3298(+)
MEKKDMFSLCFLVLSLSWVGSCFAKKVATVDIADCTGPFSCKVREIEILKFFDQPFQTTTNGGVEITFSDLNCTGFQIGVVSSSLVSHPRDYMSTGEGEGEDEHQKNWGLDVGLPNFGGACFGNFKVKKLLFRETGSIAASFYGSEIFLEVDLDDPVGEGDGQIYADTSSCVVTIAFSESDIIGSPISIPDSILKPFESLIQDVLQEELCGSENVTGILPSLIDTELTGVLQSIAQVVNQSSLLIPPPPLEPIEIPAGVGVVNFTNDALFEFVSKMTSKYGAAILNFLISDLTNGGSINLQNTSNLNANFEFTALSVPLLFEIGIESGNLSGLTSFSEADLSGASETVLFADLEIEQLYSQIVTLIEIHYLEDTMDSDYNDPWSTGEILLDSVSQFNITTDDNMFDTDLQLILLKSELGRTFEYPLSLFHTPCDSLIVNDTKILSMSLESEKHNVMYAPIDDDPTGLGELIDNIVLLVLRSYQDTILQIIDNFVGVVLRDILNDILHKAIVQEHAEGEELNCEVPLPVKGKSHWRYQAKVFSYLTALVLSIICMAILSYSGIRKLSSTTSEVIPLINPFEPSKDPSLGLSPKIPWFARVGIPTFILCLIATFISSNTGVGASVVMELTATTENYNQTLDDIPPLFKFSLWNSVHDMWVAGVYPLSLLIFVFSGLWPYTKLFLMLFAWLTPASILSVSRRETLLMFLDALGKWSLIDTYVLVLMMVAFNFKIDLAFLHVNLVVIPNAGFYLFVVATIGSLIATHVILAIHRHIRHPPQVREFDDGEVRPLFRQPFHLGNKIVVCTNAGAISIVALLGISIVFVIVGALVPSFVFTFGGLAGWALKDAAAASYSLISVGQTITHSAHVVNAGIRFIAATFFVFAFAVPLSHLVCLIVLWVTPLRGSWQRRTFVLAEVLNAWSALEVFVVSIIAALLEIGQFAEFIVGDHCDSINKILELPPFDKLLDGDDTCFSVSATLDNGCWLLFTAVLIYVFCRLIVMHICHEVVEHRYDIAKHKLSLLTASTNIQSDDQDELSPLTGFKDDEVETTRSIGDEVAGLGLLIGVLSLPQS